MIITKLTTSRTTNTSFDTQDGKLRMTCCLSTTGEDAAGGCSQGKFLFERIAYLYLAIMFKQGCFTFENFPKTKDAFEKKILYKGPIFINILPFKAKLCCCLDENIESMNKSVENT